MLALAHKVGDVVEFTGTQHYVSASALPDTVSAGASVFPGFVLPLVALLA